MEIDSPQPVKPKVRVIKKVIKKKPLTTTTSAAAASAATTATTYSSSSSEPFESYRPITSPSSLPPSTKKDEDDTPPPNPALERKKEEFRRHLTEKVKIEKKTFEIQSYLIDNSVSEEELKRYAIFLQPNHYDDVVLERAISKLCGFPICKNKVKPNQNTHKYIISTKDQKVYDQSELSNYCSTDCLSKSKLFRFTLDPTPVHLRNIDPDTFNMKPENNLIQNIENNLKIVENESADKTPLNMDFGSINSDTPINSKIITPNSSKPVITSQQQQLTNHYSISEDVDMKTTPKITRKLVGSGSNTSLSSIPKSFSEDHLIPDDKSFTDAMSDNMSFGGEEDERSHNDGDDDDEEEDDDFLSTGDDQDYDSAGEQSIYCFYEKPAARKQQQKNLPVSNYHSVYSPLSEWRTIETERYFKETNHPDSDQETTTTQTPQIKQALHHYLSLYYPIILNNMNMPESFAKEHLIDLVDTFSLTRPIPSLSPSHWKMVVLVLIYSLSTRFSSLKQHFDNHQPHLQRLLKEYGFDQYYLKVFVDLIINGYQ